MMPAQVDKLYNECLNSEIDRVVDVAMTAMQNAVDQCGKVTHELSEAHAEVFLATLKMELDTAGIQSDETLLRWFATREFRS